MTNTERSLPRTTTDRYREIAATHPVPSVRAAARRLLTASGYTDCACRDCFDTTVSTDMRHPDMCHDCVDAGCEPDAECSRDDAYGCDDDAVTPDWIITGLVDKGPGAPYRFAVQGRNLNHQPGAYGYDFSWHVASIADPRYALVSTAGPILQATFAAAKQVTP